MCDTETGELSLSEHPPSSLRFSVMADGLLGEPEARLWMEQNCPWQQCTAAGTCATSPALDPWGSGSWYAICDPATGEVGLGTKPFQPAEIAMSPALLSEPAARRWVELNCPSWRCDALGRPDSRSIGEAKSDSGGFAIRGQSDGTAEPVPGDFVLPDSREAQLILDQAERAEESRKQRTSTLKKPKSAFGTALAMTLLTEISRAVIAYETGYSVPPIPTDHGAGPAGAGAPGAAGGGSGVDCEARFCPMCGEAVDLLMESASEECTQCRARNRQRIADCYRAGGGSGGASESGGRRRYRLFECATKYRVPGTEVDSFRKRYSCVPTDGSPPTGCDELKRLETYSVAGDCESTRAFLQQKADNWEEYEKSLFAQPGGWQ
jgi:hypothetical protein